MVKGLLGEERDEGAVALANDDQSALYLDVVPCDRIQILVLRRAAYMHGQLQSKFAWWQDRGPMSLRIKIAHLMMLTSRLLAQAFGFLGLGQLHQSLHEVIGQARAGHRAGH